MLDSAKALSTGTPRPINSIILDGRIFGASKEHHWLRLQQTLAQLAFTQAQG